MALLKESDQTQVRKILADLEQDVRLLMFTQETECPYCTMARQMTEELAALSPRLSAEIHDFVQDAELARQHGIDKIPAIAVLGARDYGIRFYGVPAGYEFASLLEAITDAGRGVPELAPEVAAALARIDRPVRLQVMVTPTCPHCAGAVRVAHRLAMASEQITGDMVEVTEFPELAVRYHVQGVPKTVIDEMHSLLGAQPEAAVVQEVLKALGR